MYRRCQVSQSVRSWGTWAGRFWTGADAAEAGGALAVAPTGLMVRAKALAFSL